MKKLTLWLVALAMMLSLCACGNAQDAGEQMITRSTEAATVPDHTVEEAGDAVQAEFADFQYDGKVLNVGEAFDPAVLPKANSVYQVPSCAIEGTDNVYSYDSFEITAYDDGTGEVIYSIYFKEPDVQTPEGLTLSDGLDKVLALYGEDYEQVGTAYNYYCGDTMLSILVQDDVVISIEYRMITE